MMMEVARVGLLGFWVFDGAEETVWGEYTLFKLAFQES